MRARPTKEVENLHIPISAIPSHFGFRSESPIHSDYDVLLMGDMLYDEEIGSKVTQLAGSFRGLTLVGDPGKKSIFHSSHTHLNKFHFLRSIIIKCAGAGSSFCYGFSDAFPNSQLAFLIIVKNVSDN